MAPRTANLEAQAKFNEPQTNKELAHLGHMPKGGKYNPNDKRGAHKPNGYAIGVNGK